MKGVVGIVTLDTLNRVGQTQTNIYFSLINGLYLKIDNKRAGAIYINTDIPGVFQSSVFTVAAGASIIAIRSLPYSFLNNKIRLNIATPPRQCRDISLPQGVIFTSGVYTRVSQEQDYDDYHRSGKNVLFINGALTN